MNYLKRFDPAIVFSVFGLTGISLSIIASTTAPLFFQQLIFFAVGGLFYLVFSSIDYRIWTKFKWILYLVSLVLLLITFLGPVVRGSSRWVDLGWIRLQPSELIKPFFIMILADLFSTNPARSIPALVRPLLFSLPIVFLIFKQPDLGNVIIYIFIFLALVFITEIPWLKLAGTVGIFSFFLPGVWFFLKEYQKSRLLSFINPQADPQGAGYNALQAIIAIGSGRFLGLGFGRGTQSHLLFLPEYHTDFVFASLSEEFGFFGASLVLIFYFILLGKILMIATGQKDQFAKFFTLGIFAQLFGQVFINIGMNLGVLPITGITLPFLSYGGSSIISTFIGLGIVANITRSVRLQAPIEIK